ncbi:MAG: SCO family protein [Ignavibacteriaceae bacterium]
MKKYIFVLLPVIILSVVGSFIYQSLKEKSGNKGVTSQAIQIDERISAKNNCCNELAPGQYSDDSIYQLRTIWKNQFSKSIKLNCFLGKKVILAMFYTRCPTACPIIVNELQRLQAAIPQRYLDNYRFVLVSIDPKRDTPEILKKYADERNLKPGIWSLITGSKYQIAELAQIIGFKYKENQSGMFTHSNLITFINQKGEIQNQSEGLNQNVKMLLTMLYQ